MAVHKVTHRGRQRWRARVTHNGATKTAYRDRRDDAKEAERELLTTLVFDGQQPRPQSKEVPTLKAFVPRFLSVQRTVNRPSTMRSKEQLLRDHLVPCFGATRLSDVDIPAVTAFVERQQAAGLSANSIANQVSLLKRVLNVAKKLNVVAAIPAIAEARRPSLEVDFLDFDEAAAYLAAADEWRALVLTIMRTGLRLGEVRGLQWGDVHLDRSTLRVARAYTKAGWGAPKSGHGRTVHLSWDAREALDDLRPRKAARTSLVFAGANGNPLGERRVYNVCKATSERAEIGRVICPHKLRHTFASHHAMRGTPLAQIQAWMGHKDIQTTMRYAHLAPSTGLSFVDAIAPPRAEGEVTG